ncbi:hypothetical protein GCM10022239_19140 [Leifsonia bigeumensis]|uniref:DUF4145 domain-containing protein n=1 Tax=Leifsonella bigeumensis TaxID=433643 RepID=A0ABP7FP93_9MICO
MNKRGIKAPSDPSPALNSNAFNCPRCGAFSSQEWFPLQRIIHDPYQGQEWPEEFLDTPSENVVYATVPSTLRDSAPKAPASTELPAVHDAGRWYAALCGRCEDFSVWRNNRIMYPASSTAPFPHEDMPADAMELYEEARDVVGISRRAGAALARATLERLLKHLDSTPSANAALAVRIDSIVPKVSSSVASMLTVIRHVGNKSLHGADQGDQSVILILDESQTELVDLIFSTINALVDELITKPKAAAGYLSLIPEKYRTKINHQRKGED